MSDRCETINIIDKDSDDGYRVINKEDMQEGDKEYKGKTTEQKAAEAASKSKGAE